MTDVLVEARRSIEARLKELEEEAGRLRDALSRLNASPRKSRRGGARKSSRRRSKRAPRGQREQQFLAAVKKQPGSKAPEIAKAMNVAPNQVYGLAKRLQTNGKISKRRGGGYVVKAKAS